MDIKRFLELGRKSVVAWSDDYAPSMGAAIAYYTVFSLAPLLLIVIAVAGAVFGREAVQGEIVGQLSGLIGQDGALAVQGLIQSADKPAEGLLAAAISVVVLVVGATTVFGELQSALDRIWRVPATAKAGIWATLRTRLLSFGLILGLAFLLMVSLVVSAGVAAFGNWAGGLMPGWEITLQVVNIGISLCITTLLFAMIYKLMPQARIAWRDVWTGAAVTAVLFEAGKFMISLYVGKTSVASSFAAAGSIVVLLVWVYYSAQIFLLGAEFTWVYANEHGSHAAAGGRTDLPAPEVPRASADAPSTLPASMAAPATGGPAPGAGRLVEKQDDRHIDQDAHEGPTLRQKIYVSVGITVLQILVRVAIGRAERRRTLKRRGRL